MQRTVGPPSPLPPRCLERVPGFCHQPRLPRNSSTDAYRVGVNSPPRGRRPAALADGVGAGSAAREHAACPSQLDIAGLPQFSSDGTTPNREARTPRTVVRTPAVELASELLRGGQPADPKLPRRSGRPPWQSAPARAEDQNKTISPSTRAGGSGTTTTDQTPNYRKEYPARRAGPTPLRSPAGSAGPAKPGRGEPTGATDCWAASSSIALCLGLKIPSYPRDHGQGGRNRVGL